ncbi:MAG: amino acid permease [Ruminococcaceae bacterium]|nr:amino acid permease [Oscillospiraceae bacterium]
MEQKLERKYGLFTAICMVAGIVIGSGVFFKAKDILNMTGGDMPLGVLAWVIGGAIMMVCLLTFSFMGQKYEKVNGVVDYAEATVGKRYGYLMGWFVATIYFPAMAAVLCWVTATYTLDFLGAIFPGLPQEGWVVTLTSLLVMVFAFAVNVLSPKLAGKFQTSTTVIKLIPLGLMAVVGIVYGLVSGTLTENFRATAQVAGTSANPLFAAICASAFAYEGWIIATSINAEIKDSKKNLPKALIIGGIIIASVYIFYYLGVAGGATNQQLMSKGTTVAFSNLFGNGLGNVLKLFVAISCFGTTNGLMLACCRGLYSVAARGEGPKPEVLGRLNPKTNMPTVSSLIGLLLILGWFGYFNFFLAYADSATTVPFVFDSSELPIITIYLMYLPILIQWMRKEKDQSVIRRFILPMLALCGSVFMVIASVFSHGWGCAWYLIVFSVMMLVGILLRRKNNA